MNAIVIGSGPSGLMAALSLAKEDIDVIIICLLYTSDAADEL